MIFLPKGDEENYHKEILRSAGNTRPLNLSNTDAKIIATALNQPMAEIAEQVVRKQLRGFIKGRQMADNIMEVEAFAIMCSMLASTIPAMAFFDFRAAFPSIQHLWLFYVLAAMGIPGEIIQALQRLYANCKSHIIFAGARHVGFLLMSGIKQGCPLSGTIFALALDPFMRMIIGCIHPERSILTGFADDLAAVLSNFHDEFPEIINFPAVPKG